MRRCLLILLPVLLLGLSAAAEQGFTDTPLAGTYLYEGEGFGGDFTITLNEDGTYSFYEGMLSSYLGMGAWNADSDILYMTEDEEAGYRLSFAFFIDGGALIYIAAESDDFLYVKLEDGARFVRVPEEGRIMKLFINDTEVPVTWEDNPSTEALRQLLPLNISMSMYGGFEQVGPIGQRIVRDDHETTTAPGDIVLYSGNQIVVFYGSNSWSYTRLGHIDLPQQETEGLLSYGDVTLTLKSE